MRRDCFRSGCMLKSTVQCLQESKPVQLSKVEKASQMVLSEDGMSVTSQKGYRMV